jgi:hypothetical protein
MSENILTVLISVVEARDYILLTNTLLRDELLALETDILHADPVG